MQIWLSRCPVRGALRQLIIVACQVSLSCSSIINALYLVLFDTINTVPDVTIVKILQITSIASSIVYFSAQALYKVRIYGKSLNTKRRNEM